MRCLSLYQPWAHLLAHGLKRVETRGWPVRHRGPLLVHAAKTWNGELATLSRAEPFASALRSLGVMWSDKGRPNVPFGAVVGRVDVVTCLRTEDVGVMDADQGEPVWFGRHGAANPNYFPLQISRHEKAFGDFSPERFAWLCEKAVAFAEPIPFRGAQGVFEVPDDLLPKGV